MSSTLATIETVHLTEEESDRAHKVDTITKAKERKTVVAHAEASALAFEDAFAKLTAINQQDATLRRSFKDIVDASRESLQDVREFFAHKKKGELLFGKYATGDAWATERCGVVYGYVCRCLNPRKVSLLLKESNETSQSAVSEKPVRPVLELGDVLQNTTKTIRDQVIRKVNKTIVDAQKANEETTATLLATRAVELKEAEAKRVAKLKADFETQRKQAAQDAAQKERLSIQHAVDATAANALRFADKLPKKATTTLEANALDEAILILQGIVFTTPKAAFKEKKYFKQAVAFLKSRNAFQTPKEK